MKTWGYSHSPKKCNVLPRGGVRGGCPPRSPGGTCRTEPHYRTQAASGTAATGSARQRAGQWAALSGPWLSGPAGTGTQWLSGTVTGSTATDSEAQSRRGGGRRPGGPLEGLSLRAGGGVGGDSGGPRGQGRQATASNCHSVNNCQLWQFRFCLLVVAVSGTGTVTTLTTASGVPLSVALTRTG